MRIYLDLIVLLNFFVDFLLLSGTNRLSGFPSDTVRCMAASVCGGIYGGACLIPGFHFLANIIWRIIFLCLIGLIAFGFTVSSFRRICLFVILSMAMGGLAVCMNRGNVLYLCFSGAGIWGLCRLAFRESVGSHIFVPLMLQHGSNSVSVVALRDSGNCLRDPISGDPVYLVGPEIAHKLVGLSIEQLKSPYSTIESRVVPGLRLIPYRSVGNDGAMLLGLRVDSVKIGNGKKRALIGFPSEGLGARGEYQALVGTD